MAAGRSLLARARAVPPLPYALRVALLVGLYYAAAQLGYALNFAGPVAAIVWLPVGVAIAFLSLQGLAFWPGVLVGDLLANDYSALPLGAALGQTAGNMLEALVAAYLVRRLVRRGSPLESIGGAFALLGALALGTAISATVGPLSLTLAGVVDTSALFEVMRTWWLGDFCGALVVVPLALAWHPLPSRLPPRSRIVEGALLLATVAVLGEVTAHSTDPVAYLVFPALIWAAVRFNARGATAALLVAVTLAVWATTHYEGPFSFESIGDNVRDLQIFIAVVAASSLCLAALVAERGLYARRLGESQAQLFEVAEHERRRIERNIHDGAQQRLLALGVRLRLAAERAAGSEAWVSAAFTDSDRELGIAVDELRELSRGTHPSVLEELGLADAIRSVVARSTIPVTILALPETKNGDVAEATAYYVVLEGIANAMKHSHATAIHVGVASDDGVLRVAVRDNGIGSADEDAGTGLKGLHERVEAAGGTFELSSPPRLGTSIAAVVPTG